MEEKAVIDVGEGSVKGTVEELHLRGSIPASSRAAVFSAAQGPSASLAPQGVPRLFSTPEESPPEPPGGPSPGRDASPGEAVAEEDAALFSKIEAALPLETAKKEEEA